MKHYATTHNYNLIWMKSKFPSPAINSFLSPWEEHNPALHQEPFGGFIWPPRSYSCTFCRKDFRSAQALGGHMNVHRRDRARLKQSSPPQQAETTEILQHQKQTSDDQENRRRSGKLGLRDDECNNSEDFVETQLSMGIDLVDRGNVICKRYKKSSTVSSPLPFLHSKLCSTSSSVDDIDLELRLGDPPAVKLKF